MREYPIGKVTHYYRKIGVAVIELTEPLVRGNTLHILGHTTDLEQRVGSIQINHKQVEIAWPGEKAAVKVGGRVRPGDRVFVEERVEEEAEEFAASAAF